MAKQHHPTLRQHLALVDLATFKPDRWVRPDEMEPGTARVCSSMIRWGWVEGRQLRARRINLYRLTEAGRAAAARHAMAPGAAERIRGRLEAKKGAAA